MDSAWLTMLLYRRPPFGHSTELTTRQIDVRRFGHSLFWFRMPRSPRKKASEIVGMAAGAAAGAAQPAETIDNSEMNGKRVREWFFTINNYTADQLARVSKLHEGSKRVRFYCFQQERGVKTGTPHLQGCVVFHETVDLQFVIRLLKGKDGAHPWLRRIYTSAAALRDGYLCKEGDGGRIEGTEPVVWGDCPAQGKRNDLGAVRAAIDSGVSSITELTDIAGAETMAHCTTWANALLLERDRLWQRTAAPTVVVVQGDSNVGKTYWAKQRALELGYSEGDIWQRQLADKYWHGYTGQRCVIIEEFTGSCMTRSQWNSLMDNVKNSVSTFYGKQVFKAEHVFVTTNLPVEDWWRTENQVLFKSYVRRMSTIWEVRGTTHTDAEWVDVTERYRLLLAGVGRSFSSRVTQEASGQDFATQAGFV